MGRGVDWLAQGGEPTYHLGRFTGCESIFSVFSYRLCLLMAIIMAMRSG